MMDRFKTPTARLASTYLAIIMVLSLGFSIVIYNASSHELGRQIPPNSFFQSRNTQYMSTPPPRVDTFFQHRAQEGRNHLLARLIVLNILALMAGSGISYLLARRNLRPIEAAMDAQNQFVSDASHELRTPLTAMQTSNEVFLRKSKATLPEAKAVISDNIEDIARLKSLSDGLLNLAKQQHDMPQLSDVNLQDITVEALNQVVAQATQKDVSVQDDVEPLNVRAERASLAQALVILLDNAIKYSHQSGTVYLRTATAGKTASLQVCDEGIGIRASELPHIFRRFYRADTARTHTITQPGYGLGLAIAQQIIQSQGGRITVRSSPDDGTTFTITLPLA